jgi:YHS domain-containing protein
VIFSLPLRYLYFSSNAITLLYMARDPVCSMHVEESTPSVTKYEGIKYYFCSEGCKMSFDREPQKYADTAKGFSEKYREHSNKW